MTQKKGNQPGTKSGKKKMSPRKKSAKNKSDASSDSSSAMGSNTKGQASRKNRLRSEDKRSLMLITKKPRVSEESSIMPFPKPKAATITEQQANVTKRLEISTKKDLIFDTATRVNPNNPKLEFIYDQLTETMSIKPEPTG